MTPRRIVAALLGAALLMGLSATASADDPRARLATLAKRVQDAEARADVLADRVAKLDRQIAREQAELTTIRQRYGARARAMYESGMATDVIVVMMSTDDPGSVVDRIGLYDAATRTDDALLRRGAALSRTLTDQRKTLDGERRDAAAIAAGFAKDTAALRSLLARADAARARSAPQASRASRAALNGRYACLVGPTRAYTDTWGAPRSGGRTHKGTDVFAPWGSPAYAVADGVVSRESSSANGGLQLYLRASDGNEYFYAHLSSYVARPGQRVSAGEQVAKVGNTGDARYTSPHVHFEVHPGGGAPVDPYPYVRRFCG